MVYDTAIFSLPGVTGGASKDHCLACIKGRQWLFGYYYTGLKQHRQFVERFTKWRVTIQLQKNSLQKECKGPEKK